MSFFYDLPSQGKIILSVLCWSGLKAECSLRISFSACQDKQRSAKSRSVTFAPDSDSFNDSAAAITVELLNRFTGEARVFYSEHSADDGEDDDHEISVENLQ